MKRYYFLLLLSAGLKVSGTAQTDARDDSVMTETVLENLSAPSTVPDDSPLLDILFPETGTQTSIKIRSRIINRLQRSAGYHGKYIGSSLKSYQRVQAIYGDHFSCGVLLEKDAGEKRLNDFMSGNLILSKIGPLERFILGDYFIESGQGVALWRSYDISKGADIVLPVKRKGEGLKPYLSAGEAGFFRGVAAELRFAQYSTSLFLSQTSNAATIDSSGNITNFYTAGYYRTEEEIRKRNNVFEKTFGILLQYRFPVENKIGLTFYRTLFSKSLWFDNGRRVRGARIETISIDYTFSYSKISFFGEWSASNRVVAGTTGILIAPSDDLRLISSFRNYPYKFFTPHGLGFGERPDNERGFYIGVNMKLPAYLRLSSYYDIFSCPPGARFSSGGNDLLLQLQFLPVSKLDIACRYHRKITYQPVLVLNEFGFWKDIDLPVKKDNLRLEINYEVLRTVRIRGRYERVYMKINSGGSENGTILYYDIVYTPVQKLCLNLRTIIFRTDSYASGIYEYERDMDGVLTQPVLYGRGVRWYIFVKYSPFEPVQISLKYSDHIRDDVKKIGSGLDMIPVNHDDRLGVQIDLKL